MIRILSVALAAICVVACSPSTPADAAPSKANAAAPAVVTATATATAAPSADSARVWVTRLYANYANDSFSPFKKPADWFDAAVVKALKEDERLTPEGEMGAIDADPVCSCQDPTDMKATVGEIVMAPDGSARVKVKLQWPLPPDPIPSQIPDYTREQTLHLVMTGAGWRIHDIGGEAPDEGFLHYLEQSNAERRAGKPLHSDDG